MSGAWRTVLLSAVLSASLAACSLQPINAGTYTVRSGDTLYSIAQRFDVDLRELARLNNIDNNYRIYPGQVLRLSVRSHATSNPSTTQQAQAATTTTRKATVTKPVVTNPPPTNLRFAWPTTGSYTATTRPNGGVGLLINGQVGQAIVASAAGRVVYSGTGLLGYGQLLIIKHDEQYLTAYGHLDAVRVKEGDAIQAGQALAGMGRGPDGSPMLYFEIRVNGVPVAPLRLLPQRKN